MMPQFYTGRELLTAANGTSGQFEKPDETSIGILVVFLTVSSSTTGRPSAMLFRFGDLTTVIPIGDQINAAQ